MNKRFASFWNKIKPVFLIYIIILIGVPLAVAWFANKRVENPLETFSMFFASNKIDQNKIGNSISPILGKYNITTVNFYKDSPKDDTKMFNEYLQAYGVAQSDLMILPRSVANDTFLGYSCATYRTYIENELNFGNYTYGIKLYDGNTKSSRFTNIINFELEEDYYLLISKNSHHYSSYVKEEDSLLNSIIEWFKTYEEK